MKTVDIPTHSTIIIPRDKEGKPHSADWGYRSVIGKLNFLEKSTQPEIAYAVHMCARASSDPKESHTNAVKHIGRYLLGTWDVGIILRPDPSKLIDCYVDVDFCGLCDPELALNDPSTAKSLLASSSCMLVVLFSGQASYKPKQFSAQPNWNTLQLHSVFMTHCPSLNSSKRLLQWQQEYVACGTFISYIHNLRAGNMHKHGFFSLDLDAGSYVWTRGVCTIDPSPVQSEHEMHPYWPNVSCYQRPSLGT
jgi:hypothetical protein